MRNVTWIFVVLLLCSLTSFVEKDKPTGGLNVGDLAPNLRVGTNSNGQQLYLDSRKSKYVLLSFWASYDAQSRMQNASLSNIIQALPNNVEMISVSFDEYKSVFDETIRKDQIPASSCFLETAGDASELYKAYSLNKGFKNFLLNDEGMILAKNISASELVSYLTESKDKS